MTNKEAKEHLKSILLKSRSNKLHIVTHGEEIALDLAIKVLEERPTGDLISREALKDFAYINKGNFNTVEGIRKWIDNAPTVEFSKEICSACGRYIREKGGAE